MEKIHAQFRIESIEEIMEVKARVKNALDECNEYLFVDDDFILQVITNKENQSFGYAITSLNDNFNPKVNFNKSAKLRLLLFYSLTL